MKSWLDFAIEAVEYNAKKYGETNSLTNADVLEILQDMRDLANEQANELLGKFGMDLNTLQDAAAGSLDKLSEEMENEDVSDMLSKLFGNKNN